MFFNVGKGITLLRLLLLYGLFLPHTGQANDLSTGQVTFSALPEQCVTLRQGRSCFAKVELHWQSYSKQSFCLYQQDQKKQLGCWQNNNNARIKIEFESNKSVIYQLRTTSDNKVIAETQVEVSWQHKNTARKRRWRLF